MFQKIAYFFIHNSKLTITLVLISFFIGGASYFLLPKQYNPSIVVPAFEIQIPANGLDIKEIQKNIIHPVENLLYEIEGIDEVYGYAYDDFAGFMVQFEVGVDNESAKIRLSQKIRDNITSKPREIGDPIIRSIDPEDLSQITYAIKYIGDNALDQEQIQIYLRHIAQLIREDLKQLPNITTIEIVGGEKQDIIIELDIDSLKAKNTDILQVYQILKSYNINTTNGDIYTSSGKVSIGVSGKFSQIDELKKIVVQNNTNNVLYLEDIANIRYGVPRIKSSTTFRDSENYNTGVLIGFGKKRGTNAVTVTQNIKKRMEEVKNTFPKDIQFEIIQDEGKTAAKATNMLLINLLQSSIIVFVILAFYLGVKNALNTALSIPLTLALVFFLGLIIGDNINKITLFALILVLGMMVDNSTVVVENIARHLDERIHTGQSKLQAVLTGVQEVGFGVIMATLTRLLAFGSMFAVSGMMGKYMGPIPKYAIFALLTSLVISLSINPWISYYTAKEVHEKQRNISYQKQKYDPRKLYLKIMEYFISDTKEATKRRKIFKLTFWITLFAVIITPIYGSIFKARMLPKSDQNQIYIWVDAPRSYTVSNMKEIEKDIGDFFFENKLPEELDIVKNITTTSGQAFIGDFANLFRGGSQRNRENQISMRVNLKTKEEIKKRVSSEYFTIHIRPLIRDYLLTKYPDIELRLQEDPPGPPVMSTFSIQIQSNADEISRNIFFQKVKNEVKHIQNKYSLVDLGDSEDSTYRKIQLQVNHHSASKAQISTEQIQSTLGIILSDADIGLIKNDISLENNNLILSVKKDQKDTKDVLKNIYLTNAQGRQIPLESIVDIKYDFVAPEVQTKAKKEIKTLYAEMGDNSLVYPVIKLFQIFLSKDFISNEYALIGWNPYAIQYKGLQDGKEYTIRWGGEWELTVDTFRDLGLAMIISLLAIYFLLVGQFSSYKIAGIIMITFLLSFFGVFPGFTFLYLLQNEYFSATSMIGVIALGGIVVGNAIILIDYLEVLKKNGLTLGDALLKAGYIRFAPIILTSLTTVFGAATIIGDPVWSGLAWTIIWGLFISSILTLIVIPIFYYDSQKDKWEKCAGKKLDACM